STSDTCIFSLHAALPIFSGPNVEAARDAPLPPHPAKLTGPLGLVDVIANNKKASAADLELAARYLVMTGGDDKTIHQARNLGRRSEEHTSELQSRENLVC